MLPPLLFSLSFFVLAWWLYRKELGLWLLVPLFTGLILLVFTIVVELEDVNRVQAKYDVDILLNELRRPDLWAKADLVNNEERLLLASTSSLALFRAVDYLPERKLAIDSTLRVLAEWVGQRSMHKQWQNPRQWDRQVFFLAHTATVLAHYQLVTKEETFDRGLRDIGNHLGKRLQRGRYKHLASRPGEDFFRPADNAAALYALSQYDAYYGTNYLEATYKDWAEYLEAELFHAESRLPCSAFSTTNRCQLEPNATATGLYIAYRAAAAPEFMENDIPWREWLHYFKRTSFSPFSVTIRPNMRSGETVRFCNQGAAPLACKRYEEAVGLWSAAEYGGSYTYFRLFTAVVLNRWLQPVPDFKSSSPTRRTRQLTEVAIRAIGEGI
ncbi:MAG: hypothetical protein AAGH79_15555 [Bacteroidota bacterium]